MIEIIKNLLGKKKEEKQIINPPGRTFKRILTGEYFGCEDINADKDTIAKEKQDKIDQINELELLPMFVRYAYQNSKEDDTTLEEKDPISAHVVFQKEVLAEKWNMVHVTEISFTIYYSEFDEFEEMSGFNLKKDFRDLTTTSFSGRDRRKEKRDI